jgi:hypothetical protein
MALARLIIKDECEVTEKIIYYGATQIREYD